MEKKFKLYRVIRSLSAALDLMSQVVVGHHLKVAYIASQLGQELNLNREQHKRLLISTLIHYIGIFYLNQNIDDFSFEVSDKLHAEVGYHLLADNWPFRGVPEIIRYHHREWYYGRNQQGVPELSHLLHLADMIALLTEDKRGLLNSVEQVTEIIEESIGERFQPQLVEGFRSLAEKEYFWLDLNSPEAITRYLQGYETLLGEITLDQFLQMSNIFSHLIDFRSPFTATHSRGVAILSANLARLAGFSEKECQLMEVAGNLHDIGKLNVPAEILNKPAKLNEREMNIIKSHTYHTFHILSRINNIGRIQRWAAYHHERLDGSGYPFHISRGDLCQGARIMAVADIFTAITEDRPYRKGMKKTRVIQILKQMVAGDNLDRQLVELLIDNYNLLNEKRQLGQEKTEEYFNKFKEVIDSLA